MIAGAINSLINVLDDTIVTDRPQVEALLGNMNTLSDMLASTTTCCAASCRARPIALRGLANATGTGNAVDINVPNGLLVDSWMCAISGRAKQFGMIQYYKDCK